MKIYVIVHYCCDTEEQDETHWEIYADGYAAALFSRLEIVETELRE